MKIQGRKIAGVRVDFGINYGDVMLVIDKLVGFNGSHYLWTINPEYVMDAQKDADFKRLLNESALSIADGAGLLFANEYLGWVEREVEKNGKNLLFPLKAFVVGSFMGFSSLLKNPRKANLGERLTGADLIFKVSEHAAEKGYTMFFLGGWEKDKWGKDMPKSGRIAERTAQILKEKYPGLKVVGATSEYKRGEPDDKATLDFIHGKMREVGVEKVDIIFVCYNHLYQEKWLERNIRAIPAKVGLGTGGAFDYVIGTYKRSPNGFIRKNLEWLYKLITQPWRWKRILAAFPIFPLFVYYLSVKDHTSK